MFTSAKRMRMASHDARFVRNSSMCALNGSKSASLRGNFVSYSSTNLENWLSDFLAAASGVITGSKKIQMMFWLGSYEQPRFFGEESDTNRIIFGKLLGNDSDGFRSENRCGSDYPRMQTF
jgi:hypothetical protein